MLAYRLMDKKRSYLIYQQKPNLMMKPLTNSLERQYDESAVYGIQKLKSRIVKQISHEFRTPLTSIIGFAEILEDGYHIDEHQRMEYASYIRNEGLRLTKLVDDLIELDSLEQGQADLDIKENEIQLTVRQAIAQIAEFAYSKFITISLEIPNEPVLIKFDREKIIQVLFQLLHNAIRFTKPGGCVRLTVEASDTDVALSIHDSGPGIPAKDISSIFQRFGKLYRIGEETHCTGVGLAIVKHIIDRHNGEIAVESNVGEGSTFIVRLPIL
jgi:two-component system phosphate regulon sensor histidine kinase PhoR